MQTRPDPDESWQAPAALRLPPPQPGQVEVLPLVQPSATMVDVANQEAGIALLRKVEWCARVSHRSEERQTETSWQRFLTAVVLQHGDWSVTEHASVTVDATVDRGITHEWVRHRLGAYTQESTRFVNYEKNSPQFVLPADLQEHPTTYTAWGVAITAAEAAYRALLAAGVAPQLARSVLPTALAARLIVTYNLRAWRHFFLMRTTREAHPQMREVTIPLLQMFQARIPLLYDDIRPMARQADNLAMAR